MITLILPGPSLPGWSWRVWASWPDCGAGGWTEKQR